MTELKGRFALADQIETSELWREARRRAATPEAASSEVDWPPSIARRIAVAGVAFVVFAAAVVFAWELTHPGRRRPLPDPTPAVDLASELGPGWSELPAPPEMHFDPASAWTGSQLLVWGGGGNDYVVDDGFMFDAAARVWRRMPDGPLAPRSDTAFAWTGSELVVWGGMSGDCCIPSSMFFEDGAAYDPSTERWRTLPPAPIEARAPFSVWTGSELLIWGNADRQTRYRDGASYDPSTDTWRRIADAPTDITDGAAVWTGEEMVVFGAALHGGNFPETRTAIGLAYDPRMDLWREIPPSDLSPQAMTAAWPEGGEMIAWDYDHATAAYDPVTDRWRPLDRVPLRFYECGPYSVALDGYVLGNFCGSLASYSVVEDRWHDVSRPDLNGLPLQPIPAGDAFLVIGRATELSTVPNQTYETRMLAFVPEGSFVCAGTMGIDPLDPADARMVAETFMLLRVHDAEKDLERLVNRAGYDAFTSPDSGLQPLRGDYIIPEVVFVDGPLGPDSSYEVGVRLTASPREEVFEETLFLGPGENLVGEACPLVVTGGRPGLEGP
jgi:hypothetical protein